MEGFKCDICGGSLAMDVGGEHAVCEYCGVKYSKDRLQAIIQEIRGSVTIEGAVTVKGINTANELLKNAETYLKLGEYERAEEAYEQIVEKFPDEPEGWFGVYKVVFEKYDYASKDFFDHVGYCESYADNAKKLKDFSKEYEKLWNEVFVFYENDSILDDTVEKIWDRVKPGYVAIMMRPSSTIENENQRKLQEIVYKKYKKAFLDGEVSFFRMGKEFSGNDFWDGREYTYQFFTKTHIFDYPIFQSIMDEGRKNALKITEENSYINLYNIRERIVYFSESKYSGSIGDCLDDTSNKKECIDWTCIQNIVFLYGNTIVLRQLAIRDYDYRGYDYSIIVFDQAYSPEEILEICDKKWIFSSVSEAYMYSRNFGEQERKNLERRFWRKNGKCTECGGDFEKAIIGYRCTNCGTRKMMH